MAPRKPPTKPGPDRFDRDQLVTEEVACELLGGITRTHLRGLRDRREIAYVPTGSKCRYWRSSLLAYVEARTIEVGEIPGRRRR